MTNQEALTLARRKASNDFTAALAERDKALDHLEDMIGRLRRDSAAGNHYSDMNLPHAAGDVSRIQERMVTAADQMAFLALLQDEL